MTNIYDASCHIPIVADETNNYSVDSADSALPMICTPKRSARSLIQFWSNPHESGTTLSFTYNDKDSNMTGNQNNSNSMIQSQSSICSLNYSPESSCSSLRRHKAMLLEVSCDDDSNDETESSTNSPDESVTSHQYPTDDEIDVNIMAQLDTDNFCVPAVTNPKATISATSIDGGLLHNDRRSDSTTPEHSQNITSFARATVKGCESCDSDVKEMVITMEVIAKATNQHQPASIPADSSFAKDTGVDCVSSERLSPLPPSPASLSKTMDNSPTFSPERFPSVTQTYRTINRVTTDIPASSSVERPQSPNEDTASRNPHHFSPGSLLPPDDDLDLTSIHSEDSDGEAPRNTRHHMVNVDDHSLLNDISKVVPATIPIFDSNVQTEGQWEEKNRQLVCHDNFDQENSREHNRSNDTENMLVNVIDAAGKAVFNKSQDPSRPVHQDPSMFFDCEEYDTYSHGLYESSLQLDHLMAQRLCENIAPLSPLATADEDALERETPLRSNSTRVGDMSRVSNIVDAMTSVPILRKNSSRRKLLPKSELSKLSRKSDKKMKRKNKEFDYGAQPSQLSHSAAVGDDDLAESIDTLSVSTLDVDSDKEDSANLFWIDAFLDFVSPPEDSNSVDSDSSASTASGSHGAALLNIDASVGTDVSSSKRNSRQRKRPQSSLSRLRDWWQKELISEVVKGNLGKPSSDGETDSFEEQVPYDNVEKIVSNEFHKVLSGQNVSLLGSDTAHPSHPSHTDDELNKGKSKYSPPGDWIEVFKSALESAKSGSLGCGAVESFTETYESVQKDTQTNSYSPPHDKSFDSLDGLVQALKETKNETDSSVLSGRFQSMYEQLQQKLKEAHLFNHLHDKSVAPSGEARTPILKSTLTDIRERRNDTKPIVEALPDDSLQYLLNPNYTRFGNDERTSTDHLEQNPKHPIYSPPTPDSGFQHRHKDQSSQKRSNVSQKRLRVALARAKETVARRRRAASHKNTELNENKYWCNNNAESEENDSTNNVKVTTELSVVLEDLDITVADSANFGIDSTMRNTESEDVPQVTFDDPTISMSDLDISLTRNLRYVNLSSCDLNKSGVTVDDTSQGEGPPRTNIADDDHSVTIFANEYTFSPSQFKDSADKNNITKETVTDNSCTDESVAITSNLYQAMVSTLDDDDPAEEPSVNHERPRMTLMTSATTNLENLSGMDSNGTRNDEQPEENSFSNVSYVHSGMTRHGNRLDSSESDLTKFGEEYSLPIDYKGYDSISMDPCEYPQHVHTSVEWHESTAQEQNDDFAQLLAAAEGLPHPDLTKSGGKTKKLLSRATKRIVPRSLVLNKTTSTKIDEVCTPNKRIGFKSKAFRHAESYVAAQLWKPLDASISRSTATSNSISKSQPTDNLSRSMHVASDRNLYQSSNDTSFLSLFRQKARGIRKEKFQENTNLDKNLRTSGANLFETPTETALPDHEPNVDWEDFTSTLSAVHFRNTLDAFEPSESSDSFHPNLYTNTTSEFEKFDKNIYATTVAQGRSN
jgi:hypothetical protein